MQAYMYITADSSYSLTTSQHNAHHFSWYPIKRIFQIHKSKTKCLAFHSKFLQRLFCDKYCIIRSLPFTQQNCMLSISVQQSQWKFCRAANSQVSKREENIHFFGGTSLVKLKCRSSLARIARLNMTYEYVNLTVFCQLLGRIAVLHTQMSYCYRPSSVVCLSMLQQ